MDRTKAVELLNRALRCLKTGFEDCPTNCSMCENYATKEDGIEALGIAIKALEGKDIDVPTNSALDHIHNVVRDDAYRRGYEQGKADANRPEIPDSWIPVSERLPEEGQRCLVCDNGWFSIDTFVGHGNPYNWKLYVRDYEAWMPLPEPWKGE